LQLLEALGKAHFVCWRRRHPFIGDWGGGVRPDCFRSRHRHLQLKLLESVA
jgi:hypothetical protein